jgi:hypothetical protein
MNFIAKILLNSLYGRFGMNDNFLEIDIIHKDFYADFENIFFDNIVESQDLGDYKLVQYKIVDELENDDAIHNTSIAIAAAITAYSRIHMSQFKNDPKINLYYTDTDSIYTDSNIDDSFLSETVLGKLKLENTCNKAIFLAPKVYCLETDDGKVIYKVKGLKHEVELTMNDFEQLLYKQSFLRKTQLKFMRNLQSGNIEVLDQMYTIKVTENKIKLIYDENGKLTGTMPFIIDSKKTILNK